MIVDQRIAGTRITVWDVLHHLGAKTNADVFHGFSFPLMQFALGHALFLTQSLLSVLNDFRVESRVSPCNV